MITKSELQSRLFAEENRAAKLVAENRQLRKELEMARSKAATAEKWQGLALARHGDGRTVQEIQREAGEEFRLLLRDIYDVALERRIHHHPRGSCPEPATGNFHWRDDECPACQVLMRAAAALCDTRNGRGEIGGFHGGAAPGYVTEPRPDCAVAQHERQEAPAIGLRDCNSKNHGGQAATPQFGYLMRTTDPGCTGCVERDEDQRAESGDSIHGDTK